MENVTQTDRVGKSAATTERDSVAHTGAAPPDARGRDRRERERGGDPPSLTPRDELAQLPLPGITTVTFADGSIWACGAAEKLQLCHPLPRAEGGSAPLYSILENNRTEDAAASEAKRRAEVRTDTQLQLVEAMERGLQTGTLAGYDLDELLPEGVAVLNGWRNRMGGCGDQLWLRGCPDGHEARVQVDCCHVPVCVWETRRKSIEWLTRGMTLMELLPEGESFGEIVRRLRVDGVSVPQMTHAPGLHARMGWKQITVSLRGNGNLPNDTREVLAYRTRLARWLRNRGALAIIGALDVGKAGHPHLHMLAYAPYIAREEIQHWQRAQDCTIPGCAHEAESRTCNGSWVCDIRAAWSPHEVLKYNVDPTAEPELHLAVYLLTYGRHRVETYGVARIREWPRLDREARVDDCVCRVCGQDLVLLEVGERHSWGIEWSHPPPPTPHLPPPDG